MNHNKFVAQIEISVLSMTANEQMKARFYCHFPPCHKICFSDTNTSSYGRPIYEIGRNKKTLAEVGTVF